MKKGENLYMDYFCGFLALAIALLFAFMLAAAVSFFLMRSFDILAGIEKPDENTKQEVTSYADSNEMPLLREKTSA